MNMKIHLNLSIHLGEYSLTFPSAEQNGTLYEQMLLTGFYHGFMKRVVFFVEVAAERKDILHIAK